MATVTIVHQGALGDTILLIPLIESIRRRFGGAGGCAVTLVTRTNLGQMLMMLGFVEAYASADEREHTAWFGADAKTAPAWAAADVLISAVSNGLDAWADNARAARRAAKREEGSLYFFDPRPPENWGEHVTAWHRSQLGALELPPAVLALPRKNPDGAVLFHPGSGGDAKCWPRDRFLNLGHTLKRNGIVPTFILGEVEQEKWGRELIEELKEEFPWYLHMGLYELAERIGRARMYLGNDSGVSHIAGAMGIPTLVLFGPSNDVQWRPMGPDVRVIRAASGERTLEAVEESAVREEVFAELRKVD